MEEICFVLVDTIHDILGPHFLRSKDEKHQKFSIAFSTCVQRGLHAQVRTIQTDKGMKFLNKTLHAYFAKEGMEHQTSTAQTPEQTSVVERRNRTLGILLSHELIGLSPDPQSQENVSHAVETVTTSNKLDLLFSLMFDELLNGTTPVVSKSSAVNIVDASDKCQQQRDSTSSTSTLATTVTADGNIDL
ncbi:retrovirus-related pol polyprotein from transposon TNT 1-94 [Tanacetum coccineum]